MGALVQDTLGHWSWLAQVCLPQLECITLDNEYLNWQTGKAFVSIASPKLVLACSFQMINQRKDVVFAMFYNVSRDTGYATKNLLAKSAPLKLLAPNDPQHIHLALAQVEG